MGALHQGHRAPAAAGARDRRPGGSVVVSVFVNPLQFGPGEDFEPLPADPRRRTWPSAREEGAAVVFAPAASRCTRADPLIRVDPGPVGQLLEGSSRPGFFVGVLTVVLKLFQLVRPDVAVFGAEGRAAARAGPADDRRPGPRRGRSRRCRSSATRTGWPSPAGTPTCRPPSGRRRWRCRARWRPAAAAAAAGPAAVLAAARAVLDRPAALTRRSCSTTWPWWTRSRSPTVGDGHRGPALLLVAARVGTTRLIDNAQVTLGGKP